MEKIFLSPKNERKFSTHFVQVFLELFKYFAVSEIVFYLKNLIRQDLSNSFWQLENFLGKEVLSKVFESDYWARNDSRAMVLFNFFIGKIYQPLLKNKFKL